MDTEYMFCVDRGSTIRPHDSGIVAVIDGSELDFGTDPIHPFLIKNRIFEIVSSEICHDSSTNVIRRDHDKWKHYRLLY